MKEFEQANRARGQSLSPALKRRVARARTARATLPRFSGASHAAARPRLPLRAARGTRRPAGRRPVRDRHRVRGRHRDPDGSGAEDPGADGPGPGRQDRRDRARGAGEGAGRGSAGGRPGQVPDPGPRRDARPHSRRPGVGHRGRADALHVRRGRDHHHPRDAGPSPAPRAARSGRAGRAAEPDHLRRGPSLNGNSIPDPGAAAKAVSSRRTRATISSRSIRA